MNTFVKYIYIYIYKNTIIYIYAILSKNEEHGNGSKGIKCPPKPQGMRSAHAEALNGGGCHLKSQRGGGWDARKLNRFSNVSNQSKQYHKSMNTIKQICIYLWMNECNTTINQTNRSTGIIKSI